MPSEAYSVGEFAVSFSGVKEALTRRESSSVEFDRTTLPFFIIDM